MRLTAALAIACLVALAFAGCSGKDKDGGATSSSSSSSSHSSTSATSSSTSHSATSTTSSSSSTSSGPSNSPPTGSISAITNGTKATFTLNGTDADGDALAWDLSFGDGNSTNGTTLPATVQHDYANSTGNLTASYTVTDGTSPTTYNVTVHLLAGAAGPLQEVVGSYATGSQECSGSFGAPAGGNPFDGKSEIEFAVNPATWGKTYVATYTTTAPILYTIVAFFDDAGNPAGGTPFPYIPSPGKTVDTGQVGDKMTTGFLSSCGGANVTVDYVVS